MAKITILLFAELTHGLRPVILHLYSFQVQSASLWFANLPH